MTKPHTTLRVTGVSVVRVAKAELDADALAQPWEQARPRLRPDEPDAWEAIDFTFPSPYVEIPDGMVEYARVSFPAGRPIGEAATELMQRVNSDFTYKSGSTTTSTKVGTLPQTAPGCVRTSPTFMVSRAAPARAGRPLRQRLPGHPAAGRPAAAGRRRREPRLGGLLGPRGRLALPRPHQPAGDRRVPRHRGLGPRLRRRPPVKGVIFTEAKKSQMKVSVDMAPAA